MQSDNLLYINLAHAADAAKRIHVELSNNFFANLEQEEISEGAVHADILVLASAGDIYTIKINLKGKVVVKCDRCLEPLTLSVKTEDIIKVKDGEPHEADAIELRYLEGNGSGYDLAWDVFEIIETSLPMQRVHELGECNQDMLGYILGEDDEIEASNDF